MRSLAVGFILGASLGLGLVVAAGSKPLTAWQALEIAKNAAAPQVKDRLLQISGPRSETELTPNVWRFVFWDESAAQNGRLITVTGSAITEIRDGYFELDKMRMFAYKSDEVIAPKSLRFDSSKALETVLKTSQLQGVKLSTVTYHLALGKGLQSPQWKLQIYGDHQGKEVNLGYAVVAADTGGIVEMKLTPEKLNKK
jgi:hypothetical protein